MKNKRRIIALCLAIVMMMSMAITASAASVSWTEGSYSYSAIVTVGSPANDRLFYLAETEAYFSGGPTGMTFVASAVNGTTALASGFNSSYGAKLWTALDNTGTLKYSRTITPETYTYADLAGNSAAGWYGMYAKVQGYSVPWRVERNSSEIVDAGTMDYAPTSSWTPVVRRR